MRLPSLKRFSPLLGLGFFILAVLVLYHQAHSFHLKDISHELHAIPSRQIQLSILLTICSYLIMTGYDSMGLRYIGHKLPFRKTVFVSFLSYAFSNNIGFSMIAGASIRYRLYTAWGLSALETTKVVVFCTVSLWLGFLATSGMIFLTEPLALPQSLHWPFVSVLPIGIFSLAIVFIYLTALVFGKKELNYKWLKFPLPTWRLSIAQLTVASVDWLMAGVVLFVLLPENGNLVFSHFLEIFLLAQLAGLISQVPGGLGIFETVIFLLLPTEMKSSQIIGVLIVYRGIYYFLPLIAATAALGIEELFRHRVVLNRIQSLTGKATESIFIPLLSLVVFFSGAVLTLSGTLPAIPHRLDFIMEKLPLSVLEISHFTNSLVGVGLMLLARGINRRIDAAYLMTVGFLGVGIVVSLFKGIDYEEAGILLLILFVLIPCRRFFFRRTSLLAESFTPGWMAAIGMVMVSSIGLGFFAYRHVEYSSELWWQFSVKGDAPRFLRATVGAMVLIFTFSLSKLLRPTTFQPDTTEETIPDKVLDIVKKSPITYANLALLGDKIFLFSENQEAFIMYGISGQTWVAMGDPIGPVELWPELLWQFRRLSDRYAHRAAFYEVGPEHLHLYLDIGLTLLKTGEEARVPLTDFSLKGHRRKGLRHIQRKLMKEGYTFDIIPPTSVPRHLSELRNISDTWMKEKNTHEKRFSLGCFDADYIKRFPIAVVRIQDQITAFANIWAGAEKEELSLDLMRYLPDSPNGIMDFLFTELMLWGADQGYHWFNLGMAPFSGLAKNELAPLWHRIGGLVVRFGDHFYNFQGLRAYKEKFDPVWQPIYLATPGGLALPRVLSDIGALISGSLKGLLFK